MYRNIGQLECHEKKQIGDYTPSQTGLVFLLNGLTYAVSTQLWGYIARKREQSFHLIIYGLVIATISMMIVGPSPGIPLAP